MGIAIAAPEHTDIDPLPPRDAVRRPRQTVVAALGAALVAVSVLAVDPWGFAPFGPWRWLLVGVVALGGAAVAVRGGVVIGRGFVVGWAALLAAIVVATMRAADPLTSLLGTADRRLGAIGWVVIASAFVLGAGVRRPDGVRLVARTAAVVASIVGAYALLERVALAPVEVAFADGRVGGPLGQPAFLAAACVLLVPIAFGLAVDGRDGRAWRAVGLLGGVSGAAALVASQTRGAWIGLAVASVVIVPPMWARMRTRQWTWVALALTVIVLVVATPIGSRAESAFDAHGTGAGRVAEWEVATRALVASPVTGYGPEGYRSVFDGFVDADYVERFGSDVFVDRAHNGLLDVGLAGGVVALVSYGALMAAALVIAWRARRRDDPIVVGISVAVIAYAVQQWFLFPVLELDPVFWMLVGILTTTVTARHESWAPNRIATGWAWVALVGVVVWSLLGAADVVADRRLATAIASDGPFDQPEALAAADAAADLRWDSARAWFVAARVARSGGTIADLDDALDRIERGLAYVPTDPMLRTEHGALMLERAERSRQARDAERAAVVLDALVRDRPHDPVVQAQRDAAYALLESVGKS